VAYIVDFPETGNVILFGCDGKTVDRMELIKRAKTLEALHGFAFPFAGHAERIELFSFSSALVQGVKDISILTDASSPETAGAAGGSARSQKVGRNDSCPCGSGRKFKKCHGAQA